MAEQKTLPTLERGQDLSRIFAFTDGVFAIAITLLVLQIEVPKGLTDGSGFLKALSAQGPDLFAFGLSFAVIGFFWIGSHRTMRMVAEYDRGLMLLTLLNLAFIVLVPYSSQLMGEYGGDIPLVVVFYVLNILAITVASGLMLGHLLRAGLVRPEYEWDVRLTVKSNWISAGLMLASAPFAFLIGPWTPAIWLLLRFDPFQRRRDQVYDTGESGKDEEPEG